MNSSETSVESVCRSTTAQNPVEATKAKRTAANMVVRTLTIITLGPLVVAVGLHSNFGATCLVTIGCVVGGLEWGGLKRHLKVSLLRRLASDATSPSSCAWEEEFAAPVQPLTLCVLLKYLFWGLLAWAAYYGGANGVVTVLWAYFVVMTTSTLVAHGRCAGPSSHPNEASADASLEVRLADRTLSPAERFSLRERHVTAQRPLADRALNVCLDMFGLLWISAFASVTLLYDAPFVGKPWILSTLLANFANDIFALVTGRTLAAMRSAMREADAAREGAPAVASPVASDEASGGGGTPRRGWAASLVLAGPHALSPSISPNKSVEGALAGVLANAVGFTLCMQLCYTVFFPAPSAALVHPLFQSTPFYLTVGTLFGVLGVLGDLLESLLKRVAHVKDAGFFVPGHGGVLDRFDGLLLAFPVMYCVVHAVLAATSLLSGPPLAAV